LFALIVALFSAGPAEADNRYYEDTTATDVRTVIFEDYGCDSCHAYAVAASCGGTSTDTPYLGNGTVLAGYLTTADCADHIESKISSTPAYGGRMPDGCADPECVSAGDQLIFSKWNASGEPYDAPTAVTSAVSAVTKTSANLNGSFNPNVWSDTAVPGTYRFRYGTSPGVYTITTTPVNITGTSPVSQSTGVSSLTCGTDYYYKARVTNGTTVGIGEITTIDASGEIMFTTTACSPPVLTNFSGITPFTEQTPVIVDAAINIAAGDSGNLNQAVMQLTTNYQNGSDTLTCPTLLGGTTCGFVAGTGTLTISGSTTIANYVTMLQNVQFSNSLDSPSTLARTVTLVVTDANSVSSTTLNKLITITEVPDAPQIANFSGTNEAATEQTLYSVDASIGITDLDDTNLNEATLQISGNYVNGEDTLVCPTLLGGTSCGFVAGSGTLTISGSTSIANYVTMIQNVQFINSSDNPDTGAKTFSLAVSDATSTPSATTPTKTIAVSNLINDPPSATADGATGFPNGFVVVTEGGTVDNGTGIAPLGDGNESNNDLRANDSDPESAFTALTTTQTGCAGGDGTGPTRAAAFTLDGDGTFSYQHNGSNTSSDSFTYCVTDGSLFSTTVTVFIDITPVNDPPSIATSAGDTEFTEQTAVTVDTDLTLTDGDSLQMGQAQVQISANYESGFDTLACNGALPAGISSCSFDAGLGILTLSGTAATANYDTALQAVQFNNSSDVPSELARTISFTLFDSLFAPSAAATKTISPISRVNDIPTANDDGASGGGNGFVLVSEGGTVDNATDASGVNDDLRSNDVDLDSDPLTTTQIASCQGGIGAAPGNAAAFTLDGDGTFSYTHDGSDTTSDSFSYCVFDASAAHSVLATVFIEISPVNDLPLVSGFGGSINFVEQTPIGLNSGISITDSESLSLDSATVQITANYENGADELACNGALPAGISNCSFSAATGILTLTGTAAITDYQTALDSVTFNNTSESPSLLPRTVSVRVEDQNDGLFSTAVNKAVNLARVNDPPTLNGISDQVTQEDTAADPNTFTYTTVGDDVDIDDDTNTGNGSLTYTLQNQPSGMTISNLPANPGEITWDPPQTGTFNLVYGPVTVLIEDGDEDSTAPNSVSFSITVSPPDLDGDLVANYNDFCVSVSDPANVNTDGDGTPGTDGPAADAGGDVCDSDDDDDGMPDTYEIANSFDPLVDDAALDADGDGVSNLQEFIDGTNPNQINLVIDATGYLTPYDLVPPDPVSIHSQATAVTPVLATPAVSTSATGPYRPGNNTIIWRPSNGSDDDLATNDPGNLVTNPPTQPFSIRPLASFEVNQQVEENTAVTVTVRLNGDSPSWSVTAPATPSDATVNYSVSGTASNPADHDAVAGVLNFGVGDYEEDITFNVLTDGIADPNETIVFTLTDANNAAIGSNNTHTVTILEDNIAPRARIQFRQGGFALGSTFEGNVITIDAMPSDANAAQTLSCNWSGTDNALLPPGLVADCFADPDWDINVPVAGNYLVDVVVTDNGSPARSTRVSRILHVAAGTVVALGTGNSDGEGDDDATEGYADSDGDGIPDYLDDARVVGGHLIPDQTANPAASLLLETEPGLTLRRGSTTQAANIFGALVTDSAIAQFGSVRGDAPVNGGDDFEHVGGVYDFEIDGLVPGSSARIVIPLQSAIPRDARYRKFNPATGWNDFVVDANNQIASASGELGACPEPGSSAYVSGLNYLGNCIQLTIQDGGPNDTDNQVNGVINDPATVGVTITEPEGFEEVEEGSGGRVSPLLLAVLLMLGGLAFWRRQRGVRIDK
jgi:hypothetical protein